MRHMFISSFCILCSSCSDLNTSDLPNLNRESFSYNIVMQKQSFLKNRIGGIHKRKAISAKKREEICSKK
jgi:hypothetical protein